MQSVAWISMVSLRWLLVLEMLVSSNNFEILNLDVETLSLISQMIGYLEEDNSLEDEKQSKILY